MKNLINAYNVSAKVEGKIWMNKATTLTACSVDDAKNKAIKLLKLTDEHQIAIKKVTVFSSETKLTSENYPYGYLKTTAYFNVEFTKNGFRSIFQTINPKTGRINNPKKGTYSPVMLLTSDSENFISYCGYLDFNGDDEINKGLQFMIDFYELFTEAQLKQINSYIAMMMKVSIKAQVIYCGSNIDDLKPLFTNQILAVLKGDYCNAFLDVDKINSFKKPDFNPFKVTTF